MKPGDLSGLPALVAVADRRSFAAAAAELRVTTSAVSQAIRVLEERVGVRLLQRTTRSVGLTEAGARFLARARPALQELGEAFDALGELRDKPAGLLRLSVPRVAYQQLLADRIATFMTTYPEIDLELEIDDGFTDIVARGLDAGIRIGEMVQREMVSVRISPDLRTAIVASPAYFASHAKPRHPRDLAAHDCIRYRRRTVDEIYRWEFTERGRDFAIAVDGRLTLDDGDAMVDAALAGLGIAYTMDTVVRPHLAAKRLVRVLDAFCTPFPGFFLYYPHRAQMAPKLAALVAFMRRK